MAMQPGPQSPHRPTEGLRSWLHIQTLHRFPSTCSPPGSQEEFKTQGRQRQRRKREGKRERGKREKSWVSYLRAVKKLGEQTVPSFNLNGDIPTIIYTKAFSHSTPRGTNLRLQSQEVRGHPWGRREQCRESAAVKVQVQVQAPPGCCSPGALGNSRNLSGIHPPQMSK